MTGTYSSCGDEDSEHNELKQENVKLFELATKTAETLEAKLDLITEFQKELHYLRNCSKQWSHRSSDDSVFEKLQQALKNNEFLKHQNLQLLDWIEELETSYTTRKKVKDMKSEIETLPSVSVTSDFELDSIDDENIELRVSIQELESKVKAHVKQNKALQDEVTLAKDDYDQMRFEFENILNEKLMVIKELTTKLDRLGSSYKEFQKKAVDQDICQQKRIRKLEKTKLMLTKKVENVKVASQKLREELVKINSQLENSQSLNTSLNAYKSELEQLKPEYNKLLHQISKMGEVI